MRAYHLLVGLGVLNHVLVGVGLRINAGLGALDGKGEGVHDDDGIAIGLPLHQAHHLNGAAGASVHHHFQQRKRRDLHPTEVVRVLRPRLLLLELGQHRLIVVVDRVRIRPA